MPREIARLSSPLRALVTGYDEGAASQPCRESQARDVRYFGTRCIVRIKTFDVARRYAGTSILRTSKGWKRFSSYEGSMFSSLRGQERFDQRKFNSPVVFRVRKFGVKKVFD